MSSVRRGKHGPQVRSAGRRLETTREAVAERCARARRLTLAGWSLNDIAVRLGVDQRTVARYRSRIRAAAA